MHTTTRTLLSRNRNTQPETHETETDAFHPQLSIDHDEVLHSSHYQWLEQDTVSHIPFTDRDWFHSSAPREPVRTVAECVNTEPNMGMFCHAAVGLKKSLKLQHRGDSIWLWSQLVLDSHLLHLAPQSSDKALPSHRHAL